MCPSVFDLASVTKRLPGMRKTRYSVSLHRLSSDEFRVNWSSDSHTIFSGVNVRLLVFFNIH